MQAEGFSHSDLYRRASRAHERKLRAAVEVALAAARGEAEPAAAASGLFESCTAAIPYAPATAFLANERTKLEPRRERWRAPAGGDPHRRHRQHAWRHARRRGDPRARRSGIRDRDRRNRPERRPPPAGRDRVRGALLPGTADRRSELVGGGADDRGGLVRADPRVLARPCRRRRRARQPRARRAAARQLPHRAHRLRGCALGRAAHRRRRWSLGFERSTAHATGALAERRDRRGALRDRHRGGQARALGSRCRHGTIRSVVARARRTSASTSTSSTPGASRARRAPTCWPRASCGRAARDPRLRLVLAGGGPEQERLRERVGDGAIFHGWLDGSDLARVYANADVFLFPSRTDTFGQVILEAQASGVPVVAVAEGGPLSLIENRISGVLCRPEAQRAGGRRARARERTAPARAGRARRPRRGSHAHLGAARSSGSPRATGASCAVASASRSWRMPRSRSQPAHDRGRAARHRAGDLRALRADPRLAGRSWRRSRDAARDPGARPAPARASARRR